jgi:hypothetical protein
LDQLVVEDVVFMEPLVEQQVQMVGLAAEAEQMVRLVVQWLWVEAEQLDRAIAVDIHLD